jgi:hypothetical protein
MANKNKKGKYSKRENVSNWLFPIFGPIFAYGKYVPGATFILRQNCCCRPVDVVDFEIGGF